MCQKKEGESNISFAFRMAKEQPGTVLSVVGFIAAVVFGYIAFIMYSDYKVSYEKQIDAYLKVSQMLERQGARLDAIDAHLQQLDIWHRKEFMSEEK